MENTLENPTVQPNETAAVETSTEEKPIISESRKKVVSMRAIIIAVVIILVLAALYFYKGVFIAATVNGMPVSRLAVVQELENASGADALDAIIKQKLIDQEADKQGITVTEEEITSEFERVEKLVSDQGMTLDDALAAQGLTRNDLRGKILSQKKLEKILGDKIKVTDEDVEQYIKDNAVVVDKTKEAETKANLKGNLEEQKFAEEAARYVDELLSKADVKHWVNY